MAEQEKCTICGEPIPEGQMAEMYDPTAEMHEIEMGKAHGIVHAECGLQRGWDIA